MPLAGFSRIRLLQPKTSVKAGPAEDAQWLNFTHRLEVPSVETTYWCSTHKLPRRFFQKHHALQVPTNLAASSNENNCRLMFLAPCSTKPSSPRATSTWSTTWRSTTASPLLGTVLPATPVTGASSPCGADLASRTRPHRSWPSAKRSWRPGRSARGLSSTPRSIFPDTVLVSECGS